MAYRASCLNENGLYRAGMPSSEHGLVAQQACSCWAGTSAAQPLGELLHWQPTFVMLRICESSFEDCMFAPSSFPSWPPPPLLQSMLAATMDNPPYPAIRHGSYSPLLLTRHASAREGVAGKC
ncbi:hypothetical protein E2562_032195 [Oryza meyeriana var. granulata]|uniref:Uncharacterized protein n=1 Tax=Oryza meyeriana var. granulata TaxID=110450 RepID=A0A6G1F0D3_9ORYZ|nr:hypothetical protein E2562_032195 [Oryza meyeriana var. granulata]